MQKPIFALFALFLASLSVPAQQAPNHWVGSWASSPMSQRVNPGQPSPANSTYRNVVRISAGGSSLRVIFTNEFGSRPLIVGAAHVAPSDANGTVQADTD